MPLRKRGDNGIALHVVARAFPDPVLGGGDVMHYIAFYDAEPVLIKTTKFHSVFSQIGLSFTWAAELRCCLIFKRPQIAIADALQYLRFIAAEARDNPSLPPQTDNPAVGRRPSGHDHGVGLMKPGARGVPQPHSHPSESHLRGSWGLSACHGRGSKYPSASHFI